MKIAGWQKCTLIDFPGKIATILFTQGCNWRCPFCHNGGLWTPKNDKLPLIDWQEIRTFLEKRRGQIEGVVISGGEPTLQEDLVGICREIKELGYAIKLDTNGTNPEILATLIKQNLLDFIAMDIKQIWEKYPILCGTKVDLSAVKKSIEMIRNSGLDYEFRTTIVPSLHSKEDILNLAEIVKGAKRFALQNFVPDHATSLKLRKEHGFSPEELEVFRSVFTPIVGYFEIRA